MAGWSYLLDTNILSRLVRQPQGSVAARIAAAGEENVLTSIIVACELRYGAAKRGSRRLTRQIEAILGAITILPLEARRRPPLRCHSHDPGKEEDADQGERHAHCGPGSEARLARDWRFDGAVIVSFAVLYLLGAILMCGMLVRRYPDRGASVWVVAVVLSSVAVTLIGIQLLELWSMNAEMIRLGKTIWAPPERQRVRGSIPGIDISVLCSFPAFWCSGSSPGFAVPSERRDRARRRPAVHGALFFTDTLRSRSADGRC
jgi:PIN domain